MADEKDDGDLARFGLYVLFAFNLVPLLLIRLAFFWARGPVTTKLNLRQLALHSFVFNMVRAPIFWFSAILFGPIFCVTVHAFYYPPTVGGPFAFLRLVLMSVVLGAAYLVTRWTRDICASPDFQMELAGVNAENEVKWIINRAYATASRENCAILHGVMLVFDEGTPNEFSVEIDHLIITRFHVFAIETKYKSGTIYANAGTNTWRVEARSGTGSMRNALNQAKNTARVLKERFSLQGEVIPVVAIVGQDVKIVDGPANVVAADSLVQVIDAFSGAGDAVQINSPRQLAQQMLLHARSDRAARTRHITRAAEAKRKAANRDIVASSSVN
jgi:hypothetical protein